MFSYMFSFSFVNANQITHMCDKFWTVGVTMGLWLVPVPYFKDRTFMCCDREPLIWA